MPSPSSEIATPISCNERVMERITATAVTSRSRLRSLNSTIPAASLPTDLEPRPVLFLDPQHGLALPRTLSTESLRVPRLPDTHEVGERVLVDTSLTALGYRPAFQ